MTVWVRRVRLARVYGVKVNQTAVAGVWTRTRRRKSFTFTYQKTCCELGFPPSKRTCLELGARSCVRLRGDGGALMWMKFEVKV